jgi:hypothetical protein
MSVTEKKEAAVRATPALSSVELVKILLKHYGLSEGVYSLGVEFQIGIGGVGPQDELLPGVVIGMKSISLAHANPNDLNSVDATKLASDDTGSEAKKERKPRKKASD